MDELEKLLTEEFPARRNDGPEAVADLYDRAMRMVDHSNNYENRGLTAFGNTDPLDVLSALDEAAAAFAAYRSGESDYNSPEYAVCGVLSSVPDYPRRIKNLSGPFQPVDWLVEGWLPAGRASILTGRGGAGKSKLALQLAAALASGVTGKEWLEGGPLLGPRGGHGPLPVVWVTWDESMTDLRRAINDWPAIPKWPEDERNAWLRDQLGTLRVRNLTGAGCLWGPADDGDWCELRSLGKRLQADCEEFDARLLVIDPLVAAFYPNENNQALSYELREFMAYWDSWAIENDCAVLMIAHPAKGAKGEQSDWWGAVRGAVWTLEDYSSGDKLALNLVKSNSTIRPSKPLTLRLQEDGGWWWRVEPYRSPYLGSTAGD